MSSLVQMLRSSLGRKYLMGLTGLGLAGFTLSHMMGNLLIFLGPDAYNTYGYMLTKNKAFLYSAEAGLAAMFLIHIACAWSLQFNNWGARAVASDQSPNGAKGVSLASRSMIATGGLVAFYVVIHLWHMKFGAHYDTTVDGVAMRDLHRLTVESFSQPGSPWIWGYGAALVVLLVHLKHGVSSALQSLGFVGPQYRCMVARAGFAYAALVCGGFMAPLIYVLLKY